MSSSRDPCYSRHSFSHSDCVLQGGGVWLYVFSTHLPMVQSCTGPRLHPLPPGHAPCRSCQKVYPADALGLCPQCHPRQACGNAGCTRLAYFSPVFLAHGAFGYCSPQCRDNDLVQSGKAKQASLDSLQLLRERHKEALQRDMSRRGGVKTAGGSGWQLPSSSAESTEMEVVDNQVKAGSPIGKGTPPATGKGTGTGRADPAPKKAKRGEEENCGGCQPIQMERRVSNILHIDLNRQASKRLGLIFHRDKQHGVGSVT